MCNVSTYRGRVNRAGTVFDQYVHIRWNALCREMELLKATLSPTNFSSLCLPYLLVLGLMAYPDTCVRDQTYLSVQF